MNGRYVVRRAGWYWGDAPSSAGWDLLLVTSHSTQWVQRFPTRAQAREAAAALNAPAQKGA